MASLATGMPCSDTCSHHGFGNEHSHVLACLHILVHRLHQTANGRLRYLCVVAKALNEQGRVLVPAVQMLTANDFDDLPSFADDTLRDKIGWLSRGG
jgi:hypothetical protein